MTAAAASTAVANSADVIVIGAGIHGCSTALHLATRGARVIVIEKDYAGRHASGVNAGGVRQLARHVAELPLTVASMELWERIESLVDDTCGFESHGQVLVAETDDELTILRDRVRDLNDRGFTHEELIDKAELRRLLPAVAETCPGGIVSRRDGAADPFRTTQAFRRAAIRRGVTFHEGVAVDGLTRRDGQWTVTTTAGRFIAPQVVNAAGAWAGRIAAMIGEPVPLEVIAPMLMITSRVPAFIEPVVILRSRKLSFKQFPNGTVLIGGGHLGRAYPESNETVLDWRKLAESARTVHDLFPVMRGATIVRAWAGIEARMPDDLPVIGPSRIVEGLTHQFGFSAHGFQLGPAAGAVVAEIVTGGRTNMAIEALDIARFA